MLLSLWVLVIAFSLDILYKSTRDFFLIKKAKAQSNTEKYVLDKRRIAVMRITSMARTVSAAIISIIVYELINHGVLIVNTHTPWFIIYYLVPVLAYDSLTGIISYIIGYIYVKFNTKAPF